MNITEYYSKGDNTAPTYRCRATLRQGYMVIDADESFYRCVGANSALPFTKMVHPEDEECVTQALNSLGAEMQRLIFRLQKEDGAYRYMYGVFSYNGREQDGFQFIEISMMDIIRMHYRYNGDYTRMQKYRRLMSFSEEMYFEYVHGEDKLTIYEYVNNRAIHRFQGILSELAAQIADNPNYTFKQKAEFESFQEYFKNNAETMELELDGELLGMDCGYLHISGGALYVNNVREMIVGTVRVTGGINKNDKYYMSPHAFDNASGVYNKRAIKELAMELVNTSKKTVLLAIIDIDDFKTINDTFGHTAGDEIIAKVAGAIKNTLGNRGYVGRFGGDEFMVVTDKVVSADSFALIFKTIRKNIAWSSSEYLGGMEVTLSIGVASCPDHASTYEELFKIADKCLYIAKDKGKNRIISYKPELHADFVMTGEDTKKRMPMTVSQSCQAVVNIMEGWGNDSPALFEDSLEKFIETYDMDRISIYAGDGYQLLYSTSRKSLEDVSEPFDNMAFFDREDAGVLFGTTGIFVKNKIQENDNLSFCRKLYGNGTENFVAVKVTPAVGPKMLVFFEMIHRHSKWSSMEEGLLRIAGWSLVQRYLVMSGYSDKIKSEGE